MSRSFILLVIAILLLPLFFITPQIGAQQRYEERLSVTVIGDPISFTFWEIELIGVNVSSVVPIEDIEINGIESFTFMASSQGSLIPEVEFLKSNGYDLLPGRLANEGVFLEVDANSIEDATQFTVSMDKVFKLGFIPFDTSGSDFTFYSKADFNRLAFTTFWDIFSGDGDGFDRIVTRNAFTSNSLPIFILKGEQHEGEFIYSATVAGMNFGGITDSSVNLALLFPESLAINASKASSSSTIEITTYGSFLREVNASTTTTYDPESLKSSMKIKIKPGDQLSDLTFPVISHPPILGVTREVDIGVASSGETIESRIKFQNFAPQGGIAIDEIVIDDDWWSPHLSLVEFGGNNTVVNLRPGETQTIVKILRVTTPESAIVSPTPKENQFTYSFKVENQTFTSSSQSNDIILSLNDLRPSLIAESFTSSRFLPIGGNINSTLSLKNVGARSALSVKVTLNDELVQTIPSIAPDPLQTLDIVTNITSENLILARNNYEWKIQWEELGKTFSINSNTLTIVDNFSRPNVPALTVDKTVGEHESGDGVILNSILVTNFGLEEVRDVMVFDLLPRGSTYIDGNFTETPLGLSATIPSIEPLNSTYVTYKLRLNDNENMITSPAIATVKLEDKTFEFVSNSVVASTAVSFTKSINNDIAFIGYNSSIGIIFENHGNDILYDIEINGGDSALVPIGGSDRSSKSQLGPGKSLESSYLVRSFRERNDSLVAARVSFILAGSVVEMLSDEILFTVVDAPIVSIHTKPEIILEKRSVEMIIEISNPSDIPIRSLKVLQGNMTNIKVVDGSLTAEISELAEGETITIRATIAGLIPGKDMRFIPKISHIVEDQTISVHSEPFETLVEEDTVTRFIPSVTIAVIVFVVTWYFVKKAL